MMQNYSHWSTETWKKVIRSDESSFTIFSTSGQLHVWHTPREPECLTSTVRASGGSVMLWMTFSWHGLSSLIPLEGRVTANLELSWCWILCHCFTGSISTSFLEITWPRKFILLLQKLHFFNLM
uniref:Uncharacterized protein n=1 Tax=Anguilla anguilla TaxID=7936 RepID=A0A0E9WMS6_ANGAN